VIICQCAVVSDRMVTEVVASGARSLAHVCRATDAGQECGACVFSIKRVITDYRTAHEVGWDHTASSTYPALVGQGV